MFNEEGLFLHANRGAKIVNENKTDYITLDKSVDRVSITWDGLTLKNWNDERVFYADANTGNLTLKGQINATGLNIISTSNNQETSVDINTYLDTMFPNYSNVKSYAEQYNTRLGYAGVDSQGRVTLASLEFDSIGVANGSGI